MLYFPSNGGLGGNRNNKIVINPEKSLKTILVSSSSIFSRRLITSGTLSTIYNKKKKIKNLKLCDYKINILPYEKLAKLQQGKEIV